MSMGVKAYAQKCHDVHTPTSFYGALHGLQKCQLNGAPLGRAKRIAQKCQRSNTLPNQSQGANGNAQKCHRSFAPKLITWCLARTAPLGGSQYQATEMSMEGRSPQPITGGQIYHAEMPRWPRPHRIWAIQAPQRCS